MNAIFTIMLVYYLTRRMNDEIEVGDVFKLVIAFAVVLNYFGVI